MLIIDDLLHGANNNRSSSDSIDLVTLLLFLLILRLESLLVLDELLLHGQVIFDTLLAEQSESALGRRSHLG